jgi:hypothetical protein
LASEFTIQQQQALALAAARKRKAMSSQQTQVPQEVAPTEQMNPALRTAGRFGRNLAGGLASAADVALLVPKTAALGASVLTGSDKLKQIGQTPSMRDSVLGLIDQATGNKLQPQGALETGVDFASELMTPVGLIGSGKKAISTTEALLNPASAISKTSKAKMPTSEISQAVQKMDSETLRKSASEMYQRAEQKGGVLRPEFTNKFLDDLNDIVPQTREGKIVAGNNAISDLMERAQALRNNPITLRGAQEIDEELGTLIDSNLEMGRPNKTGRMFLEVQSRLRNAIQDAAPENVLGDKEGFELLKSGRNLWARQAKLRDVERIISRAELTDNPATSIKTGFRTLLTNPNRIRGYSKTEQEAIRKAASNGRVQDILRTFGSRLGTVITTSTMGPGVAAAASYAGPAAARGLAESFAFKKANNVANIIAGSAPVPAGPNLSSVLKANAMNNIIARGQ